MKSETPIKTNKCKHGKELRLQLIFPFNKVYIQKIKQIADARWSNSLKSWHIPYTKDAINQLKTLFPELDLKAEKTIFAKTTQHSEIVELIGKYRQWMEHKSSKTTEIYTHVTKKSLLKIKSPFDEL